MQRAISRFLIDEMTKRLPPEVEERINQIDVHALSDSGYDEFGFNKDYLRGLAPLALFFYRKWFRTEVFGIENVPLEGPAIIVPNHSGQLPLDGMLISIACMLELEKPRLPRAMVEKWFLRLPHASILMQRAGQAVGVTENADKLLDSGELALIFPEGIKGSGKTWDLRYKLQRFTLGFMELAIKHKAPVVPAAVIGGEEQAPTFYNVKPLAKALGMPYFPITPTFPWMGLLGFIPLPSKYRIYFGEPMDFSAYGEDLDKPERIRHHVAEVRTKVKEMVAEGLKERPFPGF